MQHSFAGSVTPTSGVVPLPPTRSAAEELLEKIETKTAVVGIVGLGYVGLPLALCFAEEGFSVIGFDIDESKAEMLGRGESYIRHIGADRVRTAVLDGRLRATAAWGWNLRGPLPGQSHLQPTHARRRPQGP